MFKKIAIQGEGYPVLALVYWLRMLTSRIRVLVGNATWLSGTYSIRGWIKGVQPLSPIMLEILAEKHFPGEKEDWIKITVEAPTLILDGEEYPLYSSRGFELLSEKGCIEFKGSGSRQLSLYFTGNEGRRPYEECRIEGKVAYSLPGEWRIQVENPLDEEVEQAAAAAALRILGIPSTDPVGFELVERGGRYNFSLGSPQYERSTKVLLEDCHVRIGIAGEEVTHVSGQGCSKHVVVHAIQLFMEREAGSWMPLLASSRSPVLRDERLLRALLGLWRKSLPRRLIQMGELGVSVQLFPGNV